MRDTDASNAARHSLQDVASVGRFVIEYVSQIFDFVYIVFWFHRQATRILAGCRAASSSLIF